MQFFKTKFSCSLGMLNSYILCSFYIQKLSPVVCRNKRANTCICRKIEIKDVAY